MRFSYLLIGALLVAAALFANAFTLTVSQDAVQTYGTVAHVMAYASVPAAFSVQSAYTNARVTNYGDHADIALLAPDCLSGTETVTIRATDGKTSQFKTLALTNQPARACTTYIEPTPQINAFYLPSSLTFSRSFDPTAYDLQMDAGSGCTSADVGQTIVKRIRLYNDGAAVSVTLKPLDEDEGATHTFLTNADFQLDRNELESATAYIRALKPGTHYVSLEALRGDIVVGRTAACIQVQDVFHATLSVPARVQALSCQLTPVDVQVRNDGTASQLFLIHGDALKPASVRVPAGATADVTLELDSSGLRMNENVIAVTAQGEQTSGTAYFVADVQPCAPQIVTKPLSIQAQPLDWTIQVTNGLDTPLRNVTLLVTGIPVSWPQVSDSVDLPPHSAANVSVHVTRTTDEGANPVIHVLADGKEIARHAVTPIPAGPGITGRVFTAVTDNLLWVLAALLLVVAAVLFFRARDSQEIVNENAAPVDTGSTEQNTAEYKAKVRTALDRAEDPKGNGKNGKSGNGSNGKKTNGPNGH